MAESRARAQASHLQLAPAPPASADSLCSAEAFGSSPASCVINQPEFRQSALGKRNVWCALVFSSNCFMARSARKIFQNKAIDGNYISTLGNDGMRALSALCKKHPSIRQTHVIAAYWGWARSGRRGTEVPIQDRWDPGRPLGWRLSGAVTAAGGPLGCPGICLPCLTL